MARVSQEHLDARRRQILEGAARCFARDGFHSTTMQDILRETGLSAGAVLSRGGVAAGRMASAVFSSGICWDCAWSRLRLGEGDGWASCIGGISPAEAFT